MNSGTIIQETAYARRHTNLLLRIQSFVNTRTNYMPGLASYLATGTSPSAVPIPDSMFAEEIPLHLPSSFPALARQSICVNRINKIEDRLCFAQAMEALTQLRLQLAKRTYAAKYKAHNVKSQRHYTRFRTLQDQTEKKIKAAQLQYTVARNTILSLHGTGPWKDTLKVLHPQDVRGLGECALIAEEKSVNEQMKKLARLHSGEVLAQDNIHSLLDEPLPETEFTPELARGEGTRTLSWIWYTTTGDELNNSTTEGCMYFCLLLHPY